METDTIVRTPVQPVPPAPPVPGGPGAVGVMGEPDSQGSAASLAEAVTLVVWVVCLAIGLLGIFLQPVPAAAPPAPKPPDLPPVQAEVIKVDFQQPAVAQAPPDQPPAPDESVPQDAPPLPEVAMLTPAIAFALPVEGPVRIVGTGHAGGYVRRGTATVRKLVLGVTEPEQPKPEYPAEAIRSIQQGDVGVTFTIASDGHVSSARVTSPSRWPLLNNAALQEVRDVWHFPPGPVRTYEYTFQFHLNGA